MQDLTLAPTQQSWKVLASLKDCPASTDGIVPATLSMLDTSSLYNLLVTYGSRSPKACAKALVLVRCDSKTKLQQIGEGYRMVSEVFDALSNAPWIRRKSSSLPSAISIIAQSLSWILAETSRGMHWCSSPRCLAQGAF